MSSGTKHDSEKVRWELLSVDAINEIAKVMTFGARKYNDHNWRGGFDWSRLIGAAYRHLSAWHNGQDKDPETGLSHLAHLGCCVMFLLEHETRGLGKDDRYKANLEEFARENNKLYRPEDKEELEKVIKSHTEDDYPKWIKAMHRTSDSTQIEDDGFITTYPHVIQCSACNSQGTCSCTKAFNLARQYGDSNDQ